MGVIDQSQCPVKAGSIYTGPYGSEMAGFKAAGANGHHLLNCGITPASFIVVGTRSLDETANYSDVDLAFQRRDGRGWFTKHDGKFVKEA